MAVSLHKEIVLAKWVEDCFKDNILYSTSEYRLPLFKGCIICASRLDPGSKSLEIELTIKKREKIENRTIDSRTWRNL